METPKLPADLQSLEQLLAGRNRSESPAALKDRVIRSVEAELGQAELPPKHANGWWTFLAATAASVVLLFNFSMSAASATSYEFDLCPGPSSIDQSLRQVRELLPELSDHETMRCAITMQAGSSLARYTNIGSIVPSRHRVDLRD